MYTATAKQILAPIAEAISQMMVLNLDAETMDCAMPDLTQVSGLVKSQAENLAGVGRSMVADGDDELKRTMPGACDEGAHPNFII